MINEANKIISVYTSDTSGVCSALYELDGMVVMHDASGCNSTYNTHDEPRWYDIPSRIYLSGLTEYEAVLGNEEKFINDCVQTAKEQNPKFIALCYTPIPYVMGQDIKALARIIEKKSGIPTFSVKSNGMNSYLEGVSEAFLQWAIKFVKKTKKEKENKKRKINLLGFTPLDFPNVSFLDSLIKLLEDNNFEINSVWAMGEYCQKMENSSLADINLVVSSSTIKLAKYFEDTFNIPYVVALPFGKNQTSELIKALSKNETRIFNRVKESKYNKKIAIIGENIYSLSLRNLIGEATIFSLLKDSNNLLFEDVEVVLGEQDLKEKLKGFEIVIADPLFKYLIEKNVKFIEIPHFAFSGRMYTKEIPSLINEEGDSWLKENNL